jgi:hypothetical protein
MAVPRVEIKTQPWGVVQDASGNAQNGVTATITKLDATSATVYAAATGGTTATPSTNSSGEIAGWIEPGEYNVTVPGKSAVRVQASRALQGTQEGTLGAPSVTVHNHLQPRDPAKGPFRRVFGGASFNGTWDTVMYDGYNVGNAGARELSSEPSLGTAIEQDYEVVEGDHWMEWYLEYRHTDDTGLRPIFVRIDRDDGTLEALELSSDVGVSFTYSAVGGSNAQWAAIGKTGLYFEGTASAGTTLSLGTGTGQSSQILMEHGNATALSALTVSSSQVTFSVNNNATFYLYDRRAAFGVDTNAAVITGKDAAFGGDVFVARAHASGQTGPLFAARDSANTTTYWKINQNGYPILAKTSAPADGELANGEMAIWFDKTDGAAKLMVKAKQNSGTVRTGSVTLS